MATKGRTGGKDGKKNISYLNRLKANSDSLSVYNKALQNQKELNSILDYNNKTKKENRISKKLYDQDTVNIKNLNSKRGDKSSQYYKDNKVDRRPSVIMNEQRVMSSYQKGDTLTRKEYDGMAKKYKAKGLVLDTDTTNIPVDKYGNSMLGMGAINPKYGKNRKAYKPKKLKLFNENMRSGDVEKLKPGPPPKKKNLVKITKKKLEKLPVKKTENKPTETKRKFIPTAKNIQGKRKGKREHIRLRDGKKVLIGESKRRSKRYIKKQNKKKVRQSKGYFERVTSTNPYNMNKVVRKKIKR